MDAVRSSRNQVDNRIASIRKSFFEEAIEMTMRADRTWFRPAHRAEGSTHWVISAIPGRHSLDRRSGQSRFAEGSEKTDERHRERLATKGEAENAEIIVVHHRHAGRAFDRRGRGQGSELRRRHARAARQSFLRRPRKGDGDRGQEDRAERQVQCRLARLRPQQGGHRHRYDDRGRHRHHLCQCRRLGGDRAGGQESA